MDYYKPAPRVPIEIICFIVAFVIAGATSEKHFFAIGVPLTYLLIKFSQYIKAKLKLKRRGF
ncbi:hypothetical protein JW977_01275 [Candidatus Falkowbacteria bacterium]|nr:hypothetical protein [Candidatus Falkowbacteria bacterium]